MMNMLSTASGLGSQASAPFSGSELPAASLGGSPFPPLPADFYAHGVLSNLVAISSAGAVSTAGMGAYLYLATLPPTLMTVDVGGKPTDQVRTAGHRTRELEWRRTHGDALQTFRGQWVALQGEKIIASGHDPVQVVQATRAQGIQVPYVFYVEPQSEDIARMGL